MKKLTQSIINTAFNQPPDIAPEKRRQLFRYSILLQKKVPFAIYTPRFDFRAEATGEVRNVLVKILYSHGRDEDLQDENLKAYLEYVVDALHESQAGDDRNNFQFKLMAYDYPGYGASRELPVDKNEDIKNWVEIAAAELFGKTADEKGQDEVIRVIWGYSLGTAYSLCFTAYGSSALRPDICLLEAPFESVLKSQSGLLIRTAIRVLTSESQDRLNSGAALRWIQRKEEGQHRRTLVVSIMGAKDEIIDFRRNSGTFRDYSDRFIRIEEADHQWFRDLEGVDHSCRTLVQGILVILAERDREKKTHQPDQENDNETITEELGQPFSGGLGRPGNDDLLEEPENQELVRALGGTCQASAVGDPAQGTVRHAASPEEEDREDFRADHPDEHPGRRHSF